MVPRAVAATLNMVARLLATHGARMTALGRDQDITVAITFKPGSRRVKSREGVATDLTFLAYAVSSGRAKTRTAVLRVSMATLRKMRNRAGRG